MLSVIVLNAWAEQVIQCASNPEDRDMFNCLPLH
jgi:hypothetical protein